MKIIHFLSRLAGYLATAMLGLMMLLTVADVCLRYFFNSPITGTTEVTEFMMVLVVFPALAWCAVNHRHVKVDLLMANFPPKVQLVVDTITLVLTLAIFTVITWQSFIESTYVRTTSSLLMLSFAPFYWILSFSFALFCLAILALVVEKIIKLTKGVKP